MTVLSPASQAKDDDPEMIICRGPSNCPAVDAWPCERCLRINTSESWLIDEFLANVQGPPGGSLE
jgi:hypothetical protein